MIFNRVLGERLLGGRCASQYDPRMFKGLVYCYRYWFYQNI